MGIIIKILHVTEALGGGVLNLVSQLACSQLKAGMNVTIAHSIRSDTPTEEELRIIFPDPITRVTLPLVTNVSLRNDFLGALMLISLFKTIRPDVIHLHSSKAGVLGRVAGGLLQLQSRVFYSPHGFSFLKQDISKLKQFIYLSIERFLALFGGTLVASSLSEAELAKFKVFHKKIKLIENSIPLDHILKKDSQPKKVVTVVTCARICFAKAPSRFRDLALSSLDLPAKFYWIGDGELRSELQDNNSSIPSNLSITGWRKREDVFSDLSKADIFTLLSRWEGMPLSLIEAQAAGLPAIVLNVPGCKDVVIDGITGYICNSMIEVQDKVRLLIINEDLRLKLGANAAEISQKRFSIERMNIQITELYTDIN